MEKLENLINKKAKKKIEKKQKNEFKSQN